jgi:geranylgeranylglycerol-phosphate geranylgeranyltransferase
VGKVIAALRLIRIHNCIIAAMGVWVGAYLCGDFYTTPNLYFVMLAIALLCGAGNVLNDLTDIAVDRINHPIRPIPSGKISLSFAKIIYALFNLMAIVLALLLGQLNVLIIVGYILAIFLYNLTLKKLALIGNLIVAIMGAGAFLLGGYAVCPDRWFIIPGPMLAFIFALLFHFGRELIKDNADIDGDRIEGYKTLPVLISQKANLLIISTIYIMLIVLTLIPIITGWFGFGYGVMVIGLVDIPIIVLLGYLVQSHSVDKYRHTATILKYLMMFGLMAFIAGK